MVLSDEQSVADVFHSKEKVEGFTHRFYRYPARFSPDFVRQVISELSDNGDIVLDPFMGGGTTMVEALAAGRQAIGIDINGLAHFITRVKTTPLSRRDTEELKEWVLSLHLGDIASGGATDGGLDPRTRNLPEGVGRFLDAVLESIHGVRFPRQRRFIRCALLRVGQWALDNREQLPSPQEMVDKLRHEIQEMLEGLREFVQAARTAGIYKNKITGHRTLIQASVTEPAIRQMILEHGWKPKLVLTSPPYPGVHILYHRWQVQGRRETPAPYWLADLRDGHGASYYTMGSRSSLGLRNYFAVLQRGFENLRDVLSPETTVVQVVAFSQAETQLPTYLDVLTAAGYEELQLPSLLVSGSRMRTVPNRKWYTCKQETNDASHEVLMIHRIRG
ncbi:MAG: DNA methyltransferase [Dehalococcoidia bacterium]